MNKHNLKSGFLFTTSTAFAVAFVVILLSGFFVAPVNAETATTTPPSGSPPSSGGGGGGSSSNSPTLSELGQFDGATSISEGWILRHPYISSFSANVSDPNGDQIKLQVELRRFENPFTGNNDDGLFTSDFHDSGNIVRVPEMRDGVRLAIQLSDGKYHWRARAIDAVGNVSAWQEFGNVGNVDFEIRTKVPVVVSLDRVTSSGPVGCSDSFDAPDFYPKVTIGTQPFTKPPLNNQSDVFPNDWIFSSMVESADGNVPIHIEIWDDDLLEDDQCDINPDPDKKSLDLIYNSISGTFQGDSSEGGKLVTNAVGSSKDVAEICFGISQGAHVSVCKIDPVQVVFDADINGDGEIDLVTDKPTAVLARAVVHGSPNLNSSISYTLSAGNLTASAETSTIGSLIALLRHDLFFTPSGSGDIRITVKAEQEDRISTVSEIVTVKDTQPLIIPHVKIDKCSGGSYCYGPTTNYNEAIAQAKKSIESLFPITASGLEVFDSGQQLEGNPDTGGSLCLSLISLTIGVPRGVCDDAKQVFELAKRTRGDADVGVGIVPTGDGEHVGYFSYFGFSQGVLGIKIGNIRGVLVADDMRENSTAHETSHVYGINHKTIKTAGYDTKGKVLISNAGNFMCSGDSSCITGNPPLNWIDKETYEDLFSVFRKDKRDPEILIVSGVVSRDGTATFDKWYKLDSGIPTVLTPGSYEFSFTDLSGDIINSASYEAAFRIDIDPIGSFETDRAPFAFALPYPKEFVAQITLSHDGRVLVAIDPNTKLLRDAIQMIPDSGFIKPSEQRRNALLKKVDGLEIILRQENTVAAINKLENDIKDKVQKWIVDYTVSSPLQPTKQELVSLIEDILKRLRTTI